jgi:hypothetical protein
MNRQLVEQLFIARWVQIRSVHTEKRDDKVLQTLARQVYAECELVVKAIQPNSDK